MLAAEHRATGAGSPRRQVVHRQLRAFLRRSRITWAAHCILYLAAAVFAATVLAALHAVRRAGWGAPTLALFILGTALLIVGLLLMLWELLLAQQTLNWEAADVLDGEP
jgi:hypothetical protein